MNLIRSAIVRTTSPLITAVVSARDALTRSTGWMRHRGVIVVHAGVLIAEPTIASVIDFVATELEKRVGAAQAPAVMARTAIVMRPGESVDVQGTDYAHNAVEYPGPLFRRGVVTVAAGSPQWARSMARGLSRLWGERTGLGRERPSREWGS